MLVNDDFQCDVASDCLVAVLPVSQKSGLKYLVLTGAPFTYMV